MPAQPHDARTNRNELRPVKVDEPELSPQTNAQLTEDLREAVGAEQVQVPADRPHLSRGEPAPASPRAERLQSRSFMLTLIGASGVVGGAILATVTNQWWVLPLVVLVLYGATYFVLQVVLRMTRNPERPAPSTVAAMEEDGVRDPEHYFSSLVDEFTPVGTEREAEQRTGDAHEDPATAASEHREAWTPTGGPSHPVGPGHGVGRERGRPDPQRRRG